MGTKEVYSYKAVDLKSLSISGEKNARMSLSCVHQREPVYASVEEAKAAYLAARHKAVLNDTEVGVVATYHVSTETDPAQVATNTVIGPAMLKFEDELNHSVFDSFIYQGAEERREQLRGSPLYPTAKKRKVMIIRAMDARVGGILPMDYVFVSETFNAYSEAKKVANCYEEGDRPTMTSGRTLMKALEHAVTTAAYQVENQKVCVALVDANDVYAAPNPGEYFYDGNKPARITEVLMVDGNTQAVSLIPKTMEHEYTPG